MKLLFNQLLFLKSSILLGLYSALLVRGNDHYSEESSANDNGTPELSLSLNSPYLHGEFDNEWWEFGGSTIIRVYEYIRLTSEIEAQSGWVWSKEPLHAKAWSVEFEFKIHGANNRHFGDGIAFWYTTETYQQGPVFGHKDQFKGLAVFFDTFPNGNHEHSFPYVSAMVGDGHLSYDHANDNKNSMAGQGCEANIRAMDENVRARLTYFKNDILELSISNGPNNWKTCFTLSNVSLPDKGYFGFTARTGQLYDNHDLIKVDTYVHLKHETYQGHDAVVGSHLHQDFDGSHADSQTKTSSSFFGSLLRLVGLGGIAIILFMAYRTYSKSSSLKSF